MAKTPSPQPLSLIGRGANVPTLRFPEFTEAWATAPLKEITSYADYRGKSPKKVNAGVFLVTAKNIKKGYIDYAASSEFVTKEDYPEVMQRGLPQIGDVLLTTEAPLGNVAQVDKVDIALAQRVIKFRGNDGVSNDFLAFCFLSPKFQKLLKTKAIGTTVLGIQGKVLHKLPLNHPKENEQQKIADFLTAIDTKIQQLKRKHSLMQQYKKGVMQQLFSQQVRFKDDDGRDYPDWEEKRLGDVAIINPSNPSLPRSFTYIDLESVVKGKLVSEKQHTATDAPSRAQRVLQEEDILFQMVRPYQKNNYFFNRRGNFVASTGYAQLRTKNTPQFLFQYMHTHEFVNDVLKRCTGSSYPAINSSDLAMVVVKLPCVEEQGKIADFLGAIDTKIQQLDTQITQAETFKKGLLQQMFV